MLISRRGGQLQLVTHPDHGRVAGALFEHWGNDRFAVPAPRDALLYAARHHDDGWQELDDRPWFNGEARRPAHFLEVPLPETVAPYRRGVDRVYDHDLHAGALVSMHWAGLYRTRWGLQGGEPVGHPATAEVVAEQERRWAGALGSAWGRRGLRSEFETNTWHAYEVLQTLDFLSLALCLVDLEQPSADGRMPMPGTLPTIEQPAGGRTIPSVPRSAGGEHVELALWVPEPGRVAIDPYPFAAPFTVSIPARVLEDRPYDSAEEASAAFSGAAPRPLSVRVEPA